MEQPPAEGPAALEVMPIAARIDAVFAEKPAQCLGVRKTFRLGEIRIQCVDEVDRQGSRFAETAHEFTY